METGQAVDDWKTLDPGDWKTVQTSTWSDKLDLKNPLARAAVDLVEGAAAGGASTLAHTANILQRISGGEQILDRPEVKQAMHAPESIPGKIGKFGEQAAEFLIPAMAASKVVKGASLLGRMAAEGATAGAVGAAQSGADPMTTATSAALGAAGPAVSAAVAPVAGKAAGLLRSSAEKQYGQVINATKQGNKWVSQNVAVPGLLDRGVKAWTMKGLAAKASERAAFFGDAIGKEWQNLPKGSAVELEPIINQMEQAAQEAFTIPTSGGKALPTTEFAKGALKNLESMKDTLWQVAEQDATGAIKVPVEKLRQLRQAWDEVAAQAKVYQGQQLADHAAGKVHAMAADAIREQLAADFPNIAALNKEFSFWKNVQKVVGDTIMRREGQAKPLSQQLMAGAGAIAGGTSAGIHGAIVGKTAMEGLQKAMTSPAWRTVAAVYKSDLANALAKGQRGPATFYATKIIRAVANEEAALSLAAPSAQPQLVPAQ